MHDQYAHGTNQLEPAIQIHLQMLYFLSPALEVTGSRSQQNIVGVPVQAKDSGTNRLFNVFAHPPKIKKRDKIYMKIFYRTPP